MAQSCGLSESVIRKINKGREAGPKVLAAVAAHGAVNAAWLTGGFGDPFAALSGPKTSPVAKKLFRGTPQESPTSLGELREVASYFYTTTTYWVRIAEANPLLAVDALRLGVGDYILFEPMSSRWPRSIENLPCIFRMADGSSQLAFDVVYAMSTNWRDRAALTLHDPAHIPTPELVPGVRERVIDIREDSPSRPVRRSKEYRLEAVGVFREGEFSRSASTYLAD